MKWLLLICVLALGCATPYSFQAAAGHMGLMLRSRSIRKAVESPKTPPDVKAKLALVQDARRFCFEVLKLEPSNEFSTWSPVKGSYVTYLVLAAPKLSLEPYQWHFAFIGKYAYKGYFREEDAKTEARLMEQRGYDSAVSGAFAYNASLWIAGPLPSSALLLSPGRLAELLIHELVHGTVSYKDQTQFNETLAGFVGEIGALQFLSARFGPESKELADYRKDLQQERDRAAIFAGIAGRLDAIYKSTAAADAKLAAREPVLIDGLKRLRKAGWETGRLNNAVISSHRVYNDEADRAALRRLLASVGGDWSKFLSAIKKLDPKRPSERLRADYP